MAAARIVEYVTYAVASGPGSVGAGHVGTGSEYAHRMIVCGDCAAGLQFGTHGLIDLTARGVVGRDDDGVVRVSSVASCNRRDTLLCIGNLRNAPQLFQ